MGFLLNLAFQGTIESLSFFLNFSTGGNLKDLCLQPKLPLNNSDYPPSFPNQFPTSFERYSFSYYFVSQEEFNKCFSLELCAKRQSGGKCMTKRMIHTHSACV